MDFRQYKCLLKVAELKSITKAANSLYVSQPALSAYIAKTEKELGTTIFDRTKTPLELTLAGEIVIAAGRKILAINEEMKEQIIHISQHKVGRIKVGIPGSRSEYMLPLIYPEFHKEFPDIEFELVGSNSRHILDLIAKGDIDVGIMPVLKKHPEFSYEFVCEEEIFLVAKRGYLEKSDFLKDTIVNLKKIRRFPFVLLHRGHGIRYAVDKYFKANGIVPKILMEIASNTTAMKIAASGEGLAIVPKMTIDINKGVENDSVDILRLPPKGLYWTIGAVRRSTDTNNFIENELVKILQKAFHVSRPLSDPTA